MSTDRRANALRLLESGTDFDGLNAFFAARLMNAIRDFCAVSSDNHGALASAQGHIREIMNFRDLKEVLEREVAITTAPKPPPKTD